MPDRQAQQYRVVRETTDNDQQGTWVMAESPQAAVSIARIIARREQWAGTARNWIAHQDTRQWHPVHSEPD
jgi:hypothetical protein